MTPEEILQSIGTLHERSPVEKGGGLWIRCPYHANGQERTPSLKINLENGNFPIGSWCCFGCSPRKSGNYHKLAVKLGIRSKDDDEDTPYAAALSESALANLLQENDNANELHAKLAREPIIPPTQKWRGIQGWLLNDLQARITTLNSSGKSINTTRVYLPVHVKDKWKGGIFCSWTENTQIKYENEKHDSSSILFPYDYVAKKLQELPAKDRKICAVEGPRDALNLIQNNVLALANLGGETIWNEYKSELLMDLNLSALVIATDPDNVGNRLANIIKRQLGEAIPKIVRFKMEIKTTPSGKVISKEDPGSLTFDRIQYLRKQMEGLNV
jgi:5S rRNA maturation endonuclease (ribonuclease M5)